MINDNELKEVQGNEIETKQIEEEIDQASSTYTKYDDLKSQEKGLLDDKEDIVYNRLTIEKTPENKYLYNMSSFVLNGVYTIGTLPFTMVKIGCYGLASMCSKKNNNDNGIQRIHII